MSLSGNLNTMDLAELLQWVTIGRKTGSLTFIRDKTKNYIYFKNGQIVSSRSNEPHKRLGHFLLFQGKVTEAQLKRGLEIQIQNRATLGKVLVQEGFTSQVEIERALVGRTEEVIYDLFLWEDGYFHFTANGHNPEEMTEIHLDLNSIIFEGVRRKDEWARIRSVFPSKDVVLAIRPDCDVRNTPLTALQKKMLFYVTQGKTISEMVLELHGSDFLVSFELFQLYENGVLTVKEIRKPPEPESEPATLFNKGMELMRGRRYSEAIVVFQDVLRKDPQNLWAGEQIEQAEKGICREIYERVAPEARVPYFLVPETSLIQHNLTHQEGFVASRINGTWSVKSIVMLSPLREIEVLQILEKLIRMNLVALK